MPSLGSRVRAAVARIAPPVWRILAHSLIFGLAASIADLLFNFYLVSLGYAADAAGLLSTVYRTAGVAFGLPIGVLIDRAGARRALVAGGLLYGVSWALVVMSSSLGPLIVAYFLAGAANILALTAVVPLLTGVTRTEERASIFGLNAAAALVIGLLGSAVGGVLPGLAAGALSVGPQDTAAYRVALASVVGLGLLSVLPVLRLAEERGPDSPAVAAGAELARHSRLALVRLALPSLLLGVAGGLFLPFQNLFFRNVFGMEDAAVGLVLAWVSVGMGAGALLGGPLSARLGLKRAAWMLRLCAAPAMALIAIPALPAAVAGFFLRGLFVAASYPLNDALVMQSTSARQRGAAVSLMSVLWSLGWAGAASLSGWLQVRYGFGPAIGGAVAAYVLSALAIATQPVEKRQAI
ncbi:MAG TPA: MFS transporter [Roseiflexaceae bacterium]|nr:MFS transporter [Roseiflexaceae bacterium]